MTNPITPTVVETLLVTDTGANALVVGGAIGATAGTGTVKAGTVNDSVGTMATIRAGGLALASQAATDLMKASSASQWARQAKGTSLQYLRMNSGATDIEWGSIAPTLIKEGTGTTTNASAENVDTFALASSLTIKDELMVFLRMAVTGSAANVQMSLYNSTDSVTISPAVPAGNNYYMNVFFVGAQSTTKVAGTALLTSTLLMTRATFTTSYAGAWTLALRQDGVTASDSLQWEWAVYRIAGQ